MVTFDQIKQKIYDLVQSNETETAVFEMLNHFDLNHENLNNIVFREKADKSNVVFTTEGIFGLNYPQVIRVPENVFDFPLEHILHMFVHEIIHVNQRSVLLIEDKNEREIFAYFEGVFQRIFPKLPACPNYLKVQFGKQFLRYYDRMDNDQKVEYFGMYDEVLLEINNLETI